ncbi:gamma-glutamyltransferase [Botrimarina hoheduenensis]|uniref:Glutathione hydrolase proenzyme n=1 Tax=Botrimarina hoheduenensis TaxID=2528000 RepID=A0A5C5WFH3_9BACT|nr:gamma-glutamyltransferase [Botrimarina hoheduenensis]TWT48835.1 Gamma-glutamyltranspeptidase precursor [Botrimarina hoheduenensis]
MAIFLIRRGWLAALTVTLIVSQLAAKPHTGSTHSAVGSRYAVATVQPLATDAAMAVFEEGGNAVDAAIAAALTLSVVDNHNSGIGGGCLCLVRTPAGELLAIDGRETAPALATPEMFVVGGEADPRLSQTGPLAVGTPGALAAYALLAKTAGSKPLSRLLEPGRRAAAEGFAIDKNYADRLKSNAKELGKFPATRAVFLDAEGQPHREGHPLVQADLAKTYGALIENGPDWFYRGPFAQRVGAWMQAEGGRLRASDFATYKALRREPIVSTYRGRQIIGFPPPSSGGVHVAQVLNLIERYELSTLFEDDPLTATHVVAEAMKIAFADRAHWLGDSDFVEVPRGLSAKSYADQLAGKIRLKRVTQVKSHGEPPEWRQDVFGRHTTHIAAADAEGYWVAITATVNTGFGSKVIVPGTGVILNNEMDDFSIQPGTPNAFGLVGAANNAVAAGKRPLSSMSPTLVLDAEGRPLMALGAAGGPKIISQVILMLINTVDRQMSLAEAVAAPRWHHQWRPDVLSVEKGFDPGLLLGLLDRGHTLTQLPTAGVGQAIGRDAEDRLIAVNDPRVAGKSAAR